MRLKYITLCLLGLSISGCTQHVIKTNTSDQSLGQQATQGLNAMFENANYDMKGQFSIQTDIEFDQKSAENKAKPAESSQPELDPKLKKQLDQLIKTQKIPFSQKEKKLLYQAIANESIPPSARYYDEDESASPQSKIAQSLVNVLNDLQFSYSGSVHFREKLAALTLQLSYQKPTLQVNAQLPMIFDFDDHKFYTNYFAFMPFMVNRESQDRLAYVDFSKHKEALAQYNLKKFADYLKQMNALPYLLAEQNQVQSIDLSRDEKNAGLIKKIRYVGDVDTVYTQLELFDYVNARYYTSQIKGQPWDDTEQSDVEDAAVDATAAESAMEAAEEATRAAAAAADASEEGDEDEAYASVQRVNELVNAKIHNAMYHGHDQDDEQEYAASEVTEAVIDAESAYATAAATDYDEESEEAHDATAANAESDEDEEIANNLSEEVCQALIKTKQVPIGKVTLCQDYQDIRVIPLQEESAQLASEAEASDTEAVSVDAVEQLKPVFQQYQTEQLVDAKQFQQLWQKHQPEIQQALNTKDKVSSTLVMDVGLEKKGRVQTIDYNMAFSEPRLGQLKLKSTNQILNYGNATAIDRQAMKQAKSIQDVSKGSLFESMLNGLLSPITGQDPNIQEAETASVDDISEVNEEIELPEYLSTVALNSYKRHQSELKAYQAAFAVAFANYRAQYVGYYSANDLNEISEVYAYRFAEGLKEPTGQALKRLNQLRDKHALHRYQDFDDLGSSVNYYVQSGIGEYKGQAEWTQLKKTYKTKQAIFAHLYQKNFLENYELDSAEKAQLVKAAQIYARAFVDDTNGKLSEASLQGLAAEHEELFSQSVYYETYKTVQKHMK